MRFSSVLSVLFSLLFVSTAEAVTQERFLKSGKKKDSKKKAGKKKAVNSIPVDDERRSPVVAQVFTMTNDAEELRGNEVVMYNQMNDGSLQVAGRFPTVSGSYVLSYVV
jgi:hypothetical protein